MNNVSKFPPFGGVGETMSSLLTYVDEPVVGDLPAGLEAEDAHGAGLLGGEVGEGGVRHVVGLGGQCEQ